MNNDTQTQLALNEQPEVKSADKSVNMQLVLSEWRKSKTYVDQYTRDFQSLDNLVDGVPLNQQPDVPFVGDTTLAGLTRQIPRASLQQLPTFAVAINGSKVSIAAVVATYLLKKTAFNEDTFGKGLLSMATMGAEEALKHGYAPFMCATGTQGSVFGTKLRLLHYSDASFEPGIQDGDEMGYSYAVANLTETKVRRILKNAEGNPSTNWNVEALKLLLENPPKPKNWSMFESSPRSTPGGDEAGATYQIVSRNETGPYGAVVRFCPDLEEMPLYSTFSRSKFGYPKIQLLVIDPAPLHPFGISRVRLASPNQNLMNIYYGNIASMLLLNSRPPVLKQGRFRKPIQLKAGDVWEALDPNSKASLVQLDNGALAQFPVMAQQFITQIKNIMGNPTNGIGGASEGYSKVGPGVKMQQNDIDAAVNQITKILENFLRQYALVALDTLLCEQTGQEKIIVDDETKNAINEIMPGTVGADNKIFMDWERFYGAIEEWSVEVSVSVSKDELEEKKRGDLQDMLVVLAQNAQELGPEAAEKVQEITNMLMADNTPLVKPLSPLAPGFAGGPPNAAPVPAEGVPQSPAPFAQQ